MENNIFEIDYTVNPWARDSKMDNHKLNSILNIGYTILNNSKIHLDTNKDNNLDDVKELLLNIEKRQTQSILDSHEYNNANSNRIISLIESVYANKSSCKKGAVAEEFLENTIVEYFPDDCLIVTKKDAHAGDMLLQSTGIEDILIESKYYTNAVPSKEIQKFKDDMERTNKTYGLFLAFDSNITGKPAIELERNDNRVILYVSNLPFEKDNIKLIIHIMKIIASIEKCKTESQSPNINDKVRTIMTIIQKVDDIFTDYSKTLYVLRTERNNIHKSLDNIQSSYIETGGKIKYILDNIRNEIHTKLNHLNELEQIYPIDLIENIDKDRLSIQIYDLLCSIIQNLRIHKYIIKTGDNIKYDIYKDPDDDKISEITVNKTKIKLNVIRQSCMFTLNKSDSHCIDNYIRLLEN